MSDKVFLSIEDLICCFIINVVPIFSCLSLSLSLSLSGGGEWDWENIWAG